jgi:hypothetical protein
MDDPFLNYFALFMLFFVVIVMFYGIIAIHDIPYRIAEARHHPHRDAIHAAGWVSLFTLHVMWPFLWIWAMVYRPERGWGFDPNSQSSTAAESEFEALRQRVAELEHRQNLTEVKRKLPAAKDGALEANRRSMSLEENIVQPTPHTEEDLSQQGKVVQMPGVDGDLTRRAKG